MYKRDTNLELTCSKKRPQGCRPSGTVVPFQDNARLGNDACLSMQLHTWHVLDAPGVAFLHLPDMRPVHLVQQWLPPDIAPFHPSSSCSSFH